MQTQDIEAKHDSDPYLEHMKTNWIMQIKNTMEYIVCKLEQMKEENPWEKLEYTVWYRRVSALNENTDMGKPKEITIAYMAEMNMYLTKRINVLEMKLMQDMQVINHDPTTIATPMNESTKMWAAVAARPANPKQPTSIKARPTQTPMNTGTPEDPMADPRCLII